MTNLWKLLKETLHEKNFKTKTDDTSAEERRYDTRCDPDSTSTGYEDATRRRRPTSCYADNDDFSCYDGTVRGVSSSYNATASDFYIGVNSATASTIYLPTTVRDGKIIIIKSEVKPPLTPRKITIATVDGSKIDGYSEDLISVSHDARTYIFRSNEWHRIS